MSIFGKIASLANPLTLGTAILGSKVPGAIKHIGSGLTNHFTATPYGQTQGHFVPGRGGGIGALIGGHYEAGGVDPAVAAAFNYQDPNAPAYSANAQQQAGNAQQAYAQQQGVTQAQNSLAGLLNQSATGQGPSVASMQFNQDADRANAAAASTAQNAIANGVNPALAFQQAQTAQAGNVQAAANNAAQQKVNETLSGRQQLAGLLGQQAGQNLEQQDLSGGNALNYYGMGQQGTQFGSQAQQGQQQFLADNYNQAQQINSGVAAGNVNAHTQLLGAGIGAISSLGASAVKSDERAKEAIDRDDAGRDVDDFINALDTASWRYKKGVGEDDKRHWGVMAQSLAKTDVGRSLLRRDEQGFLNIDTRQGFGAVLAAQKRLADRIADLERVRAA